jgi:hypothetical protein
MPSFLSFTQTMQIKSKTQNSIAMFFSKKPYTLAGFEHGSAVSEADAMSTAPLRQGKNMDYLVNTIFLAVRRGCWNATINMDKQGCFGFGEVFLFGHTHQKLSHFLLW